MALAALRSRRSLGPLVRLLRPATRSIATATAPSSLYQDASTLPIQGHVDLPDKRHAIKHAKPFSEFLTDNYNRQHDYLRISVTERCNLRCLYCMPEEGVPLSPQRHLLTTPEIVYLSSLFVSQGVTKIRLTGGEPTVRPDILPLMQQIGSLKTKGLRELALTTNGISLHRKLDKMVEAGLTGVNISLDTLDPFQFQILTRRKGYDAVMKSIDRVLEMNKLGAGVKLKVNCVVMRGINERELIPFVEMGREKDIEVRFIEYMPFGGNKWSERKMLTYQEMLDIIREKYPALRRVEGHLNDTSKTFEIPGFVGKIGFITSMTHNFCGTCNRLRITGDGNLKVCLHGNTEVSLRDLIRKDNNNDPMDEQAFEAIRELEMSRRQGLPIMDSRPSWIERETELLNFIGEAVKRKKEKHAGMGELENMENRPMILIAEEKNPWRNSGYPVIQTRSSRRLGQNVPLQFLHAGVSNTMGARMYSSSSNGKVYEEPQINSSTSSTTDKETQSGFTSLRGLFGITKNTWSSTSSDSSKKDAPPFSQPSMSVNEEAPTLDPFVEHPADLLPGKNQEQMNVGHEELPSSTPVQEQVETAHVDVPFLEEDTGRNGNIPHIGPIAKAKDDHPWDHALDERETKLVKPKRMATLIKKRKPTPTISKIYRFDRQKPDSQSEHTYIPRSPKPLPPWKINQSSPDQAPQKVIRFRKDAKPDSAKQSKPLQTEEWQPELFPDLSNQAPRQASAPQESATEAPATNSPPTLTHLTSTGEAHMVDVGQKESTDRVAVAVGHVALSNTKSLQQVLQNSSKKGDVLGVARIAGIMAAKKCSDLIPLCHPVPITKVTVDIDVHEAGDMTTMGWRNKHGIIAVEARVHSHGKTGIEMEALTSVTAACLTVYDMLKAVDKNMSISSARVVYKAGGKSGTYVYPAHGFSGEEEKFVRPKFHNEGKKAEKNAVSTDAKTDQDQK